MIDIRYSIIIPHYNSPKLLQRCLDSIPIREDIEVIVVDDCSNPDIVTLAQMPGQDRPYTQVYQTPQGGSAGRARNIGLEHAKGEWLVFADADDFFTTNAWQIMDAWIDTNYDIIYFDIESVISDTLLPSNRRETYGKYITNYLAFPSIENERWLRFKHDVPWGKMIKNNLVKLHNILFDETRWCNDTMFSVQVALYAKNIHVVSPSTYCITDTSNSLTKQSSLEAIRVRYLVQLRKNRLLQQNNLRRYQTSILFYIKQAAPFGFHCILQFIRLGIQWKCNFFIRFTYKLFKK